MTRPILVHWPGDPSDVGVWFPGGVAEFNGDVWPVTDSGRLRAFPDAWVVPVQGPVPKWAAMAGEEGS